MIIYKRNVKINKVNKFQQEELKGHLTFLILRFAT